MILASSATPAAAGVIDSFTNEGDQAWAVVSGSKKKPKAIRLKVKSDPSQSVSGSWTIACVKREEARFRKGSFNQSGNFKVKIALSLKKPKSCDVFANAELAGTGKIALKLVGK